MSGLLHGLNATCLAYGQTGSGKTFTMEGPELHLLQGEGGEGLVGVIPRMVRGLFAAIDSADDSLEFTLSVSFVEIYCEQLRDLLTSVDTDAVVAAHTSQGSSTPAPAASDGTPALSTPGTQARGTPLRPPGTPPDTPLATLSPPPPAPSDSHRRRASTSNLPSTTESKGGARGGAHRRLSTLSPPHAGLDTPGSKASNTPGDASHKLAIREDKAGNVFLEGATEVFVTSPDMVLGVLQAGNESRSVAATAMNSRSSRSHSVFRLQLVKRDTETLAVTRATLFLVDLAGSEKIKKTHAEGQQLKEGQKINQSLSALGNVINALTDGKSKHIPYRNSKLTRLLQDSLGGNSRTSLIINASPASYNAEETLSSLRFGQRAKSMKNKPTANKEHSPAELKAMLAARDTELKHLKELLRAGGSTAGETAGGSVTDSGTVTPQELLAELDAERHARHDLEEKLQAAARQEDDLTVARRTAVKASAEAAALKLQLEQSTKGSASLQGSAAELLAKLDALNAEHEDTQEELKQEQAGSKADRALRTDVEHLLGSLARSVQPVLSARNTQVPHATAESSQLKQLPWEFLEALQMGVEAGSHSSADTPPLLIPAADSPGKDGAPVEVDSVLHAEGDEAFISEKDEAKARETAAAATQHFGALKRTVQLEAWRGPDALSSDLGKLFSTVGGIALSAIHAQGSDGCKAVEELGAASYSAARARFALQACSEQLDALRTREEVAVAEHKAAELRLQNTLQAATHKAASEAAESSSADELLAALDAQLQQNISALQALTAQPAAAGGISDVSQLAAEVAAAAAVSTTGAGVALQQPEAPSAKRRLQDSVSFLTDLVAAVQQGWRSHESQLAASDAAQDKLLGNLENRVRRVIELEMTLDEAQERFAQLETTKDRPSVELARENASLRRALSEQAGRFARDSSAVCALQSANARLNARLQELRNELTSTRTELAEVQRVRQHQGWLSGAVAYEALSNGAGTAPSTRAAPAGVPAASTVAVTPTWGVSRAVAASLGMFSAPSADVIRSWTKPVSVRGGGRPLAAAANVLPGVAKPQLEAPPRQNTAAGGDRLRSSAGTKHRLHRSTSFSEHNLPSSLAAFSP